MSKIKVSTVKMNADVQVIGLNAYFIAKAVRCLVNTEHALLGVRTRVQMRDETGHGVLDEYGKPVGKTYEDGSPMYDYNPYELAGEDIDQLFETLDFLKELTDAFLGEEKSAPENKEPRDANVDSE